MIWNLVALVFAGIGAAGIGLTLRSLSRKKLPKWIVPVFAGIGMLSYQIYSEYTWYEHKQAQLPPESEVIATQQGQMIWRPWSYLYPLTTGFTVLDSSSFKVTQVQDDLVAEFVLYQFERSHADNVIAAPHLLNCSNGQMLKLTEERKPDLSSLKELAEADPLRTRVCNGV
ncbi:hypothetical protein [Motiliproteus sediminis]|uniref:hypothetical protein n=1 Tax=Motiliproteus sediminis TaxID=1468178 RepID=UPI001AEF4450|nr:hypothetical protein [Motiliproteus sediminis]